MQLIQKITLAVIFASFFPKEGLAQQECKPCHTEFGECTVATGESGTCVAGECAPLCAEGLGALIEKQCFPTRHSCDSTQENGAHCINLECKTLGLEYNDYATCEKAVKSCCASIPHIPLCAEFLKRGKIVNTYCNNICSAS